MDEWRSSDRREGCLTNSQELGAETRLPLLLPCKRRVHLERGGCKDLDLPNAEVHSGTVQGALEDALANFSPREGPLPSLIQVLKSPLEFRNQLRSHRDVDRRRIEGYRIPEILHELQALGNGKLPQRIEVDTGRTHVQNLRGWLRRRKQPRSDVVPVAASET